MRSTVFKAMAALLRRLAPLAALLLAALPAQASTLLSLSVSQLSQQAAMVFEGEVIAVETQRVGARGLIHTFVTFQVDDLVKGEPGSAQLELRFLGGTESGERLEVNGSRLPRLGERGIYFVESLTENLINPLLGWSQGHYLIARNGSAFEVTTVENKPVTALSAVPEAPQAGVSSRRASELRIASDMSLARGLSAASAGSAQGLTPAQFKAGIRALLP
mgnify:CR=1 FL=1